MVAFLFTGMGTVATTTVMMRFTATITVIIIVPLDFMSRV
jgi:hypothetical protein